MARKSLEKEGGVDYMVNESSKDEDLFVRECCRFFGAGVGGVSRVRLQTYPEANGEVNIYLPLLIKHED